MEFAVLPLAPTCIFLPLPIVQSLSLSPSRTLRLYLSVLIISFSPIHLTSTIPIYTSISYANALSSILFSANSDRSIRAGGLGILCRPMYRLMNHGNHTFDSYEMKVAVGTEKISAQLVSQDIRKGIIRVGEIFDASMPKGN